MNRPGAVREFGRRWAGIHYRRRPGSYAVALRHAGGRPEVAVVRFRDRWFLPGGGREEGETPEQTLHREVAEELAWRVRILRKIGEAKEYIPTISDDRGLLKEGIFFEVSVEEDPAGEGEPGHEALWVPVEGLPGRMAHESHTWAVQKAAGFV